MMERENTFNTILSNIDTINTTAQSSRVFSPSSWQRRPLREEESEKEVVKTRCVRMAQLQNSADTSVPILLHYYGSVFKSGTFIVRDEIVDSGDPCIGDGTVQWKPADRITRSNRAIIFRPTMNKSLHCSCVVVLKFRNLEQMREDILRFAISSFLTFLFLILSE